MHNSFDGSELDTVPKGDARDVDGGMGKEGPRYAVEEMAEVKLVVFHL